MRTFHVRRAVISMLLAALASPLTVAAQQFPSKPVTIIVPSPPGGPSDIITRLIAQHLTASLGQSVVVENRPGAAGFVGMQAAARSAPDGYTLILSSLVYQVLNPVLYKEKLPYTPDRDFIPVALLAHVPYILVAAPNFPPNDVKQVVQLAKQNPDKFNYGLPGGIGNTSHIAGELFKKIAGIDLVPVPYQGDAQSLTALMGNQIELQFTTPLGVMPHANGGRMKILATATPVRLSVLPDVPTFAEQGFPDMDVSTWFSFLAPAATPRAVAQKLNTEINKVLEMPQVQKQIEKLGAIPAGGSLENIQSFMKSEAVRWAKRVEDSGAKTE